MTNKEKYKQAFSTIHISDDFNLEVEKMKKTSKQHKFKTMAASVAACIIVVGSAGAVYAADVGGIQRTIQIWMNGEQTNATLHLDGNGNYEIDYIDRDGNAKHQGGGGVAFEADGTERPLTEEEIMTELTYPEVEYEDDGTVWVYWYGQKLDITDRFENDFCYVKLENGDDIMYLTVKYQNGYGVSLRKYDDPSNFD